MNKEFAIESFIAFCDDMMIAEEGLKDIGNKAKIVVSKFISFMKRFINQIKIFFKGALQKISNVRYVNVKVYRHAMEVFHNCDRDIIYPYFLLQYDYSKKSELEEKFKISGNCQLRNIIDNAIQAHSQVTSENVKSIISEITANTNKAIKDYDGLNRMKKEWSFLTPDYIKKMKQISSSKDYQKDTKDDTPTHNDREYSYLNDRRRDLLDESVPEEKIKSISDNVRENMDKFLDKSSKRYKFEGLSYHINSILRHVLSVSQEFAPYIENIIMCWNMYLVESQKCHLYNFKMVTIYINECGNIN